jgi:NAD(P)-dependent dehydrogenase (short-subunit alcohol dehydrogenase family)
VAVIVSGGTFGIGLAISLGLAEAGHDVVAFGLDAPQVSSIAQNGTTLANLEAAERGVELDALDADVTDDAAVARVVTHALERFGRIDALVNNAAIGPLGTILTTSVETFAKVVDVNLGGTYRCCKAVIPHMIAHGGGRIVNIGSGAGWGKPNMLAYSASKGGIFALSAALAYDHFHDRIRVNVVVPGGGGIASGMSLGRVSGDREKLVAGAPGTAAGRFATGDDIAGTVAFLLSPAADAISGTVIDVGCFAHQGGPIPKGPAA